MQKRTTARFIRMARQIHQVISVFLFTFFFILSISGILLGVKKHSKGVILPKTEKGQSSNPADWMPLQDLIHIAHKILKDSISPQVSTDLQRIDIRQQKGIAKFIYHDGFWGIQLDCSTGEVLAINKRKSDIIENIHDGSILDYFFETKGEPIKLAYTLLMGFGLLFMTATGLWMLVGKKILKQKK